MLAKVKTALRIKTDAFDDEITDLINAAYADLGIAGVVVPNGCDAIITRAVITYCRMNFSLLDKDEYKGLKSSYDEQKAQLSNATGYTDWGGTDV